MLRRYLFCVVVLALTACNGPVTAPAVALPVTVAPDLLPTPTLTLVPTATPVPTAIPTATTASEPAVIPTFTLQPTPTPRLTPTPLHPVVLIDNLFNADTLGWQPQKGFEKIADGKLWLAGPPATAGKWSGNLVAPQKGIYVPGDATLQIILAFKHGPHFSGPYFLVSEGYFALILGENRGLGLLRPWHKEKQYDSLGTVASSSDETVVLKLVFDGDKLTVWANDQWIASRTAPIFAEPKQFGGFYVGEEDLFAVARLTVWTTSSVATAALMPTSTPGNVMWVVRQTDSYRCNPAECKEEPGGYIAAGQQVVVLSTAGKWAKIRTIAKIPTQLWVRAADLAKEMSTPGPTSTSGPVILIVQKTDAYKCNPTQCGTQSAGYVLGGVKASLLEIRDKWAYVELFGAPGYTGPRARVWISVDSYRPYTEADRCAEVLSRTEARNKETRDFQGKRVSEFGPLGNVAFWPPDPAGNWGNFKNYWSFTGQITRIQGAEGNWVITVNVGSGLPDKKVVVRGWVLIWLQEAAPPAGMPLTEAVKPIYNAPLDCVFEPGDFVEVWFEGPTSANSTGEVTELVRSTAEFKTVGLKGIR